MLELLYILIHVLCFILSTGWLFNYYQSEFKSNAKVFWKTDLLVSAFCSILGPLSVILCFLDEKYTKHGWSLTPLHKKERRDK